MPIALPGVLTGMLLALAIAIGETAPLLYTAGWSQYLWTGHFTNESTGYLTYAIWAFITEPFASAHALAYAAAFFVTCFVLVNRGDCPRRTGRERILAAAATPALT